MKTYLLMIHESLQPVFSFINKALIVTGILLAITGYFFHFHSMDLPHTQPKTKQVRAILYKDLKTIREYPAPQAKAYAYGLSFASCTIIGEACTNNPDDGDKNFSKSGIGFLGNMIALPYSNPPASGVAWVQHSFEDVGFTPKSYAAGVGFYSLQGFNSVWKIFRNITFLLMAIAIVVVGFLIMFRVKLDAQTVISIENSLPRIIITLLLITFSYAIAGFLVDMMYVVIMIVISLLGNVSQTGIQSLDTTYLRSIYLTNDTTLFSVFWNYFNVYMDSIRGILLTIPALIRNIGYSVILLYLNYALYGVWSRMTDAAAFTINGDLKPLGVGVGISFPVGKLLFFIIYELLFLVAIPFVFALALIFITFVFLAILMLRIFWMLLNCYVQVIINIIFAPVLIIPNVLPGNDAFMNWFKKVAGNLAAFPVTIALLITVQLIALNDEFIGSAVLNTTTQNGAGIQFSLPLIPLNSSQIVPIIAGIFLFLIPGFAQSVVEAIAGKPVTEAGVDTLFGGGVGKIGNIGNALVGQFAGQAAVAAVLKGENPLARFGIGKKAASTPPAAAAPETRVSGSGAPIIPES